MVLLILEALFLWITCFFAALSTREIAFAISFFALDFLARRMAISSPETILLLTWAFLLELPKALLAVFVTGIFSSLLSRV